MRYLSLIFLIFLVVLSSCRNSTEKRSSTNSYEEESSFGTVDYGYEDGTYCAEIEYYNPRTGTRSTYTLEVEIEDNELTKIYWPNGGWLDDSHFYPPHIEDGHAEFTSDRGVEYSVEITEENGCYSKSSYSPEDLACPRCGDEKDEYDG